MANQYKVGSTATSVQNKNGVLRVVYHNTCVVEKTPEGIKLDSGGWKTATTKTRMNQASNQFGLGFQVYSKAGKWFVDYLCTARPFYDGMVL